MFDAREATKKLNRHNYPGGDEAFFKEVNRLRNIEQKETDTVDKMIKAAIKLEKLQDAINGNFGHSVYCRYYYIYDCGSSCFTDHLTTDQIAFQVYINGMDVVFDGWIDLEDSTDGTKDYNYQIFDNRNKDIPWNERDRYSFESDNYEDMAMDILKNIPKYITQEIEYNI